MRKKWKIQIEVLTGVLESTVKGMNELRERVGTLEKLRERTDERVEEMRKRAAKAEERADALEKKVEELAQEGGAANSPESSMSLLMQQGIDSILSYQWPPAKGGDK